ncbi:hypothetical protein GCM10010233_66190 [Streptomyces pseudogriseolus]|nr:hypothetical protein GCM10010233_66190 [Streptomyces gancidicus]
MNRWTRLARASLLASGVNFDPLRGSRPSNLPRCAIGATAKAGFGGLLGTAKYSPTTGDPRIPFKAGPVQRAVRSLAEEELWATQAQLAKLQFCSYLVDPASSHMLVSKIKPCMSKYKRLIQ